MQNVYLSPEDILLFTKIKQRSVNKRVRWFCMKKLNHLNSYKFRNFWQKYCKDINHSNVLYEIQFRSSFSFYLYLYLKSLAIGYMNERDGNFTISQPIDVNFGAIIKLSAMSKNTIKKAFFELINAGLLLYREDFKPKYHNSTKSVLLINDFKIAGYDKYKKRVIYSVNKQ